MLVVLVYLLYFLIKNFVVRIDLKGRCDVVSYLDSRLCVCLLHLFLSLNGFLINLIQLFFSFHAMMSDIQDVIDLFLLS
jgi:hypothetical protein